MRRRSVVEEVLEHRLMRLLLAVLIIVSVLPFDALEVRLRPFFLVVFGLELVARLMLIATRRVRPSRADWAFLLFDTIALVSFLPLEVIVGRASWLRAFRLVRLLVLVRFTRALAADVWRVLTRREQIQQLALVTLGVLSLTFVGAVVVAHLGVGHDYDYSGSPGRESFWDQLWWTFQQVEDPGNLVTSVRTDPVALGVSLLLTIFGIFIFSYLIGVGSNVVEQVLRAERRRPIGYSNHTIVIGPVHESELMIAEFVRMYEKNAGLRHIGPKQFHAWLFKGHPRPRRQAMARIALLGRRDEPPDFLFAPGMRRVGYRSGDAADPESLERVNIDEAKRVVLIAPDAPGADADAITVARLAAIRARNRTAHVFVEVKESRNESLVSQIGGPGTFPLDSNRFLGLFLCQHLIVPGVETLLEELLSARGNEMYTHLFVDDWERRARRECGELRFEDLAEFAHREHHVTLLGAFVGSSIKRNGRRLVPADRVKPWVNPLIAGRMQGTKRACVLEEFRGFFGIADTYVPMRDFAHDVLERRAVAQEGSSAETLLRRVALSEQRPLRRVLVVGYSSALAPMIEALAHFVSDIEVRVVLDGDRQSAARAAWALGVDLDDVEAKELERNGRLRVIHEPFDLATAAVRHVPSHGLDAAVFLSSGAAADADATTMLRVLHFVQSFPADSRYRLLAELVETHRGEQLAHQLSTLRLPVDLTLLSTNQIKNYFMVHSAFVPGLTDVYARLLGTRDQEIVRLPLRADPTGKPVRFDAIRRALTTRGVIPLALQVAGKTVMNPRHDQRFSSSDIQAIYALADSDRLQDRFPEQPSLPPPID